MTILAKMLARFQRAPVSDEVRKAQLSRAYHYVAIKVETSQADLLSKLGLTEVIRDVIPGTAKRKATLRYWGLYGDWAIGDEASTERDLRRFRQTPGIRKAVLVVNAYA